MVDIWQSINDNVEDISPIANAYPVEWIFWRHNLINQFCSLPEDEAWAIDALLKGSTFGEICEGLCQWVDDEAAAMKAASLLKGWLSAGLIISVILRGM